MGSLSNFFGVPRVPTDIVHRKRLFDRLSHDAELTVVRGPAGFGKTTLVADWVSRLPSERRGVWVNLRDLGERPGVAMWQQIVHTMLDAGWGRGRPSLREFGSDPAELRPELGRTVRAMGDRCVMVIDHAGDMPLQASLELTSLLAECPNLDCILITRESGFPISNAKLILETNLVDADELLLTDDELEMIIGPRLEQVPNVSTDDLARAIGRLPAAARAAALTLDSHWGSNHWGADPGPSTARNRTALMELLSAACRGLMLAAHQDAEFGDFLITTSVAPELTVELARALSGSADAGRLLQRAAREGLGSWQTGSALATTQRPFRYATGVRASLEEELRQLSPERVPALIDTLGDWAERHGEPLLALRCWMDRGDLDRASAVVRDHMGHFLRFHSTETTALIESVPLARLRDHPYLTLALAVAYNLQDDSNRRANQLLAITVTAARLHQRDAATPERFSLLAAESIAHRMMGELDPAVLAADSAMRTIEDLTVVERDELSLALPDALNEIAATYLRSQHLDHALASLSTSFAITGPNDHREQEFQAAGIAAAVHALRNDFPSADRVLHRIDRALSHEYLAEEVGGTVRLARMIMAIERLELAEAKRFAYAPRDPQQTGMRLMFGAGAAVIAILEGRAGQALLDLGELRDAWRGVQLADTETELIDGLTVLALLSSGQRPEAVAELDQMPARRPLTLHLRAVVSLLERTPQRTLQILAGLGRRKWADDMVLGARWAETSALLRAIALVQLERDQAAVEALAGAAPSMLRSGRRLPLAFVPRGDLERLAETGGRQGSADVVELLQGLSAVPQALPDGWRAVQLTDRERVVLSNLVVTGSATEISEALGVSPNTVKSQIRTLYRKLGVRSRADALMAAAEQGLIARGLG